MIEYLASIINIEHLTTIMDAAPEIEIIGGEKYYSFQKNGVEIICNMGNRITSIMFFSGYKDDFKAYKKPLPYKLSFSYNRLMVRKKIGQPFKSSDGGEEVPFFGRSLSWDAYKIEDCVIHLEYASGNKSIALVTVMIPEIFPG